MQITAHYTLTPAEALRGTRAFKRRWYAMSLGSGALLTLMGLGNLILSPDQRGLGVVMLLNGLLFLLLPELVLRWARLRRGAHAYTPMAVTFDDEGLTLRTDSAEGGLAWSAFELIQRRSGFWIFRVGPSQAVIVPERALAGTAEAQLTAFLQGRNLLKA